eukprot:TRINITY_DN30144_c0_g1_i2.p1 TRINITY_DN30144_c0_g1~~TRINITY_DN30144_c0_g1_i2.p1  ORF type:complete len:380 (-),score=83.73 TRINITY_DN30144_c0_g1_i2:129-1268(-)
MAASKRVHVLVGHVLPAGCCRADSPEVMAQMTAADTMNRKLVVKSIPEGLPTAADFELVSESLRQIGDGEMLLRTRWLTVDPYMRTHEGMGNPKAIGRTMGGGSVAEVIESRAAGWNAGDLVVGYYGWQEYCIAKPTDVQFRNKQVPIEKWDRSLGPESTALGVLGMTGYTAYFGLLEVGRPQSGETVVVSAASGAVGQVVGQIAKIKGCRVVGIAGGKQKCDFCINELGFDECVDYKAPTFRESLKHACPKGVDVYFENVGGEVLDAVIPLLKPDCRVPICGFVSQYNNAEQKLPWERLREAGFRPQKDSVGNFKFFFWSDPAYLPRLGETLRTLAGWVKDGKLKYRETVSHGLETIIDTFVDVLQGRNFGKALVKLA